MRTFHKHLQSQQEQQQGFTLIELLVVTVLLAIISSIAIPLLRDNLVEAYTPEAEAVLASISTGAQRCRFEKGGFDNTICTSEVAAAPTTGNLANNWGVDTNSTNKWTFTYTSSDANVFTAKALGNTADSDLNGKTITLVFDISKSPHEQKTYNF
jgi:prepilin-type N-terminal cleavage/methylation domain-containing protein